MFLIIKFIFMIFLMGFMLAVIAGFSLWARIRHALQNPFLREGATPPPPPGKGDIIEGEYKVLDEHRDR